MIFILSKILIFLLSLFFTLESIKRANMLLKAYNKKRFAEIRQERINKKNAIEAKKISEKIMRKNSEEVASYGELFLQRNGI